MMYYETHTKKRNRLEQKRFNKRVFVQYNQRLKGRHQERFQIEVSIIVKDLDPTSEWLVEDDAEDEHVFKGESLTRRQVQEEAGLASSPMKATRSQTQRKGKEVAQEKGKGKGKKKVQTNRRMTILEEKDADSEETREKVFR
ncbi:hypothetical protein AMTR_s00034p00134920 [Amborella trichopoda]|uniref:Uncharacterized protein n=1 Tax=Amborella trichopoda TaxID=13333 RepID=W1PXP0_AMBTC|nr:hypothetical protein AMTR_s00034p00134920 [Amborella trichopoda]